MRGAAAPRAAVRVGHAVPQGPDCQSAPQEGRRRPERQKRRADMAEEKKGFDSVQSAGQIIEPQPGARDRAWINMEQYEEMYKRSVEDPEGFWAEQAEEYRLLAQEVGHGPRVGVRHAAGSKWFQGGKTNVAYNCLDRHLTDGRRNKAAIIWEADEGRSEGLHLPVALLQGLQVRERAQEARHQEGRPRRHLHADDPRARRSRCSRARASARSTPSSSAASRPNSLRDRIQDCGVQDARSPPTRASVAAASCR